MSETPILNVALRERVGKGASRQMRREGKVPGVIYGNKREAAVVTIEHKELVKALNAGGFFTKIFDLTLDDKTQQVLPRDVQFDPVTDDPLHVDFFRVAEDAQLTLNIPVQFINEEECPGLKSGGVLNVVRFDIEMNVAANAIPEYIECDLTGMEINDSLHISAVKLPEGAEPTISDRDFTIATIAAPSIVIEPEDEEVEGEIEGEIDGETGELIESEDGQDDSPEE